MAAGAMDAFIAIYFRPFARPIGKLMAETLGFYKGQYFTYMKNQVPDGKQPSNNLPNGV
jgi:hypothetical protein